MFVTGQTSDELMEKISQRERSAYRPCSPQLDRPKRDEMDGATIRRRMRRGHERTIQNNGEYAIQ